MTEMIKIRTTCMSYFPVAYLSNAFDDLRDSFLLFEINKKMQLSVILLAATVIFKLVNALP